jgi:hypothetical protein
MSSTSEERTDLKRCLERNLQTLQDINIRIKNVQDEMSNELKEFSNNIEIYTLFCSRKDETKLKYLKACKFNKIIIKEKVHSIEQQLCYLQDVINRLPDDLDDLLLPIVQSPAASSGDSPEDEFTKRQKRN